MAATVDTFWSGRGFEAPENVMQRYEQPQIVCPRNTAECFECCTRRAPTWRRSCQQWCIVLLFLGAFITCLAAFLWNAISGQLVTNFKDSAQRGQFGDSFGFVAALATLWALFGTIIAVHGQIESARYGDCERLFLQLIGSHQAVINSLRTGDGKGRQALDQTYDYLKNCITAVRAAYESTLNAATRRQAAVQVAIVRAAYDRLTESGAEHATTQFFLLTHRVVKYLHTQWKLTRTEKDDLMKLFRSHFSRAELGLLYYNQLTGLATDDHREMYASNTFFKHVTPYLQDPLHNQLLFAIFPGDKGAAIQPSIDAHLEAIRKVPIDWPGWRVSESVP